jgi:hypothetical protein
MLNHRIFVSSLCSIESHIIATRPVFGVDPRPYQGANIDEGSERDAPTGRK